MKNSFFRIIYSYIYDVGHILYLFYLFFCHIVLNMIYSNITMLRQLIN